jgi:hypothetical protein
MLPAVRITEVPSERHAEHIQTGRRFTFFLKKMVGREGVFFFLYLKKSLILLKITHTVQCI